MNTLKMLRESRNMTQVKLSELTGIAQGDISKMESDKRSVEKMTGRSYTRLADALNIDVGEFFKDYDFIRSNSVPCDSPFFWSESTIKHPDGSCSVDCDGGEATKYSRYQNPDESQYRVGAVRVELNPSETALYERGGILNIDGAIGKRVITGPQADEIRNEQNNKDYQVNVINELKEAEEAKARITEYTSPKERLAIENRLKLAREEKNRMMHK